MTEKLTTDSVSCTLSYSFFLYCSDLKGVLVVWIAH